MAWLNSQAPERQRLILGALSSMVIDISDIVCADIESENLSNIMRGCYS